MNCEVSESGSEGVASIEFINCLYGYAMILVENCATAEDLVHETYVRAIPSVGRLQEEGNIKGWLFRTFRNIWLQQLEEGQTHFQITQAHVEGGSEEGITDLCREVGDVRSDKQKEEEQIWAAIQKLPREFREVIFLREFERFSYYEIASLLDFPVGTVIARLAGARSRLRVLLPSLLNKVERDECLKRYN